MKKIILLLILFTLSAHPVLFGQAIEKTVKQRLSEYLSQYPCDTRTPTFKIEDVKIDYDHKTIDIQTSESFAYQPFRPDQVERIYSDIKQLLPGPVCFFKTTVYSHGKPIEELIPNLYLKKKDKSRLSPSEYKGAPWVSNHSRPYDIKEGLENRHLALWQSHGKYYRNETKQWEWQRPRLFCTTEDLFTQSFVVPYLIPMLENAGAYVYTPRERDTQTHEVIVDNDTPNGSVYLEIKSRKGKWQTTNRQGFAQRKSTYEDGEAPFQSGSARYVSTEKKGKAFAEWVPTIPETGKYAVYVSYQSLPGSISNANYLVFHKGGVTEFTVNQQIGGGTWVYLGTFEFDKGNNDYGMVVLNNKSKERGVVCADAVRFGGGIGNIKRGQTVSGLPRYLEGARYNAQWSGMPQSVYSNPQRANDYADDINTRSNTINYLSGGSIYNPQDQGLKVPFEMTLALHSDAGHSKEDEIIGSLGVYTTDFNNGLLQAGHSRYASRDLTDIVLTQLNHDIQKTYPVDWTRRSMWDRNYSETLLPAVPSTIIELLSHQNFADLKLGHDPNFKFTVSRAIYKGILEFLSTQHHESYTVQPLPVTHFTTRFGKKKNTVELSWRPENDPLEPTATPKGYVVYTRIGYGGFDNGVYVSEPHHTLKIEPGLVYSFKVTAVNRGGESFPSEILSAYKAPKEQARILIINGFDRLSGPAIINTATTCGFDLAKDPGVAYHYNLSLCGAQQTFDRKQGGKEGEGSLGYSGSELEGIKVAGNTFDYPFIHGKAIQASGAFSFVSSSDEAVEENEIDLEPYTAVDYILGLEKDDPAASRYYKTFTSPMQRLLTSYCQSGGRLLVSGSYLGSDMNKTVGDREFTQNILKYRYQESIRTVETDKISGLGRTVTIPRELNPDRYAVTAPESLQATATAFPVLLYHGTDLPAAIAYKDSDYRTFVLGFPFESIKSENDRSAIMATVLKFFLEK